MINSAILCEALAAQGYTIIEYNGINDSKEVTELITVLELKDQVSHSKCFTYRDKKYRLVFIHEDLNEEERTIALAHEEGHIWCGHMARNNTFGEDVIQEYEANEFSHYLLKDKTGKRKQMIIRLSVAITVITLLIGMAVYYKQKNDKMIYTDDFYRTENGTKYHIKDCIYIKDRTDVFRLKREEFDSGEFEPCEVCLPNKR